MRRLLPFLPGLLIGIAPMPAAAADAAVIGPPAARRCFEAAAAGMSRGRALRACDAALADPALTAAARAATLTNRGIIRAARGDHDGALADYDAALALDPLSAEAFVNKGLALLHRGDARAAIEALTRGIDLGPARPELAHYARAIAQETLGHLRDAYNDYGMARQLAPAWEAPVRELSRFRIVRRKTMSA